MEQDGVKVTAHLARQIMESTSVAETLAVLRREFPDVTDAAAAALHDQFHAADDAHELSDEALSAIAGGVLPDGRTSSGYQANGEWWVFYNMGDGTTVINSFTNIDEKTMIRSWTQ